MDGSVAMLIAVLCGLIFCVVVHECAHGLVALWLGDRTARDLGRLTLNPIPHIDPIMSILVPVLCYFGAGFIFGGAKPVPVIMENFRINRYIGMMLVAAAGPISNFLLAIVFALSLNLLPLTVGWGPEFAEKVAEFLLRLIALNLVLAFFNLVPIPPLDGSKMVAAFLPREIAHWIYSYQAQMAGMFAIVILIQIGGTRFLRPLVQNGTEVLVRFAVFGG
jgi:Zn-dependent protease